VSTVAGLRWRNGPSLARYLAACLRGEAPERNLEQLEPDVQAYERVMLGLRLDEPLETDGLEHVLNRAAVDRLARLGLVEDCGVGRLRLTRRGRFLGSAVTAALLEEIPANQPVPAGASASIGS
jgi:coproporphyrinogen III oxidase-like Fe-S oxidoreductase